LADIYDRLKQHERANDTYEMVPAGSPLRRSAEIQSALNLEQLERKDDAIEKLEGLLKRDPKDFEALSALGNIYRGRKDFARAGEIYTRAIDAVQTPDAGHWTLYYFRGIAYERTKQWPKAEIDMKKALELSLSDMRAELELERERADLEQAIAMSLAIEEESTRMLKEAEEEMKRAELVSAAAAPATGACAVKNAQRLTSSFCTASSMLTTGAASGAAGSSPTIFSALRAGAGLRVVMSSELPSLSERSMLLSRTNFAASA
jgi:tetratricopeptide (TPR) repeat protein